MPIDWSGIVEAAASMSMEINTSGACSQSETGNKSPLVGTKRTLQGIEANDIVGPVPTVATVPSTFERHQDRSHENDPAERSRASRFEAGWGGGAEHAAPEKKQLDGEAFEERAAILEYDAGMSRPDAEQLAREMLTATERPAAGKRSCPSCSHLRRPGKSDGYCGGERPDLMPAYGAGRPLRRLPQDQGESCPVWSDARKTGGNSGNSGNREPKPKRHKGCAVVLLFPVFLSIVGTAGTNTASWSFCGSSLGGLVTGNSNLDSCLAKT